MNVLIGIEREKFNYLYKYNKCTVCSSNTVDCSYDDLIKVNSFNLAEKLENALPLFEREDEVLFIEYDKSKFQFENGLSLCFSGVLQLIPLNKLAHDLIQSKINQDFLLAKELPLELYIEIKWIRERRIRNASANKILKIFNLSEAKLGKDYIDLLETSVKNLLLNKDYQNSRSAFQHLISYDITPSFIPSGNVESFIKLGCIALKSIDREESLIVNGPFYQTCFDNKTLLNQESIKQSYLRLMGLFENSSSEDKVKISFLQSTLNKDFPQLNTFLIYYIFLSLNRTLHKNEFDLSEVKDEVLEFFQEYRNELSYALFTFGYIHSYGKLYESYHRMDNAPLFKAFNEMSPVLTKIKGSTMSKAFEDSENKVKESLSNSSMELVKKSEEDSMTNKVIQKELTLFSDESMISTNADQIAENGIAESLKSDNTSARNEEIHSHPIKSTTARLSNTILITIEKNISIKGSDFSFWEKVKMLIPENSSPVLMDFEKIFRNKDFRTKDGKLKAPAQRVFDQILNYYKSIK